MKNSKLNINFIKNIIMEMTISSLKNVLLIKM